MKEAAYKTLYDLKANIVDYVKRWGGLILVGTGLTIGGSLVDKVAFAQEGQGLPTFQKPASVYLHDGKLVTKKIPVDPKKAGKEAIDLILLPDQEGRLYGVKIKEIPDQGKRDGKQYLVVTEAWKLCPPIKEAAEPGAEAATEALAGAGTKFAYPVANMEEKKEEQKPLELTLYFADPEKIKEGKLEVYGQSVEYVRVCGLEVVPMQDQTPFNELGIDVLVMLASQDNFEYIDGVLTPLKAVPYQLTKVKGLDRVDVFADEHPPRGIEDRIKQKVRKDIKATQEARNISMQATKTNK